MRVYLTMCVMWITLCGGCIRSVSVQSAESTAQEKSFHLVSRHLVKEVISPNENVRKQV